MKTYIIVISLIILLANTMLCEKHEIDCTGHEGDNVWLGEQLSEKMEQAPWWKTTVVLCKDK